ncbi:MAG: helix-turn-helix domain-containing protein [Reichenbachiella sp.]|uniref:helix-turn-helix domain-containing protein n=1 Tax=Reichenbachiella sp. TaxID=2184521 RepID=UPI003266117F
MYFEYKDSELNALLRLTDSVGLITEDASIKKGLIHIIWNRTNTPVTFYVDDLPISLAPNEITTTTYVHLVRFDRPMPELTVVSFNREFYCINDHDHEVSCNGILFMGARDLPIIPLHETEQQKMEALVEVFKDEFETRDNIQGEMLRMLLKRLIIKCTRLVKEQTYGSSFDHESADIIRKYNVLVDANYKSLKQVSDYADLLFKSPKTLSNLFLKHGSKSPLQIIHERIAIEARRLLIKSEKTAKEIAFDLGFDNVSSFNKLFKKVSGQTPIAYRAASKSREE